MTFWAMLDSLILGPLKLLFEFVFSLANRLGHPGLSIIVLSLCMNVLVLPLYRRADAIQEAERETEARLAPDVAHIRKYFQGDQRFMTLQTFYRQNHYSQMQALKGLLPLLLEIPFFIAAYQFLSNLELLKNASFGPIRDLGLPDGMIKLGEYSINVLPVLMTIINLISSAIYTRGASLKTKIQLYAMAGIFLVLLYSSPAGLTMYWTLNNLFSLVKNILTRPGRKIRTKQEKRMPGFLTRNPDPALFFMAAAIAALLTGALIPSAVIVSSPSEFMDAGALLNPLWYVAKSLLLSTGTFVVWLGIYYLLGNPVMKKCMETVMWILAGIMVLNYMAFHKDFGSLSSILQYEQLPVYSAAEKLLNLGIILALAGALFYLFVRSESLVKMVCITGALAIVGMSGLNVMNSRPQITMAMDRLNQQETEDFSIRLSQKGKNVIVLMLDRAISSFVPSIFEEKPELEASYDGFVYYPNTLSHGKSTNFGIPGLFGGYEYTPWEMNQRSGESIPDKHNEALLVLPTIFAQNNYQVTVADPPFAGDYYNIPNLSMYEGMQNTHAFITHGMFDGVNTKEGKQALRFRNFYCYALCEVSPWAIQGMLYNLGHYNQAVEIPGAQIQDGLSVASGESAEFLSAYRVLTKLSEVTEAVREDYNTVLLMTNTATHEPMYLQTPDYVPQMKVDNTAYDQSHQERFEAGEHSLNVENAFQMSHYHVNMAALLQVGKWLDYLREQGVYDNTRIILVADHGENLGLIENGILPDGEDMLDYNPLLMIKDFDSHGEVTTDYTFMTNADVPVIAMNGLIDKPVNPFTGEIIDEKEKNQTQRVTTSSDHSIYINRGNVFLPAEWYEVNENVLDLKKWAPIGTH